MFAPGVPNLMTEFQSTNIELGTFVVSIYVLGFAFGPMVLAPLSELYGRMPIVSAKSIPSEVAQSDENSIISAM
jgi:MFS family permease